MGRGMIGRGMKDMPFGFIPLPIIPLPLFLLVSGPSQILHFVAVRGKLDASRLVERHCRKNANLFLTLALIAKLATARRGNPT
jgi:hypothetical protein